MVGILLEDVNSLSLFLGTFCNFHLYNFYILQIVIIIPASLES